MHLSYRIYFLSETISYHDVYYRFKDVMFAGWYATTHNLENKQVHKINNHNSMFCIWSNIIERGNLYMQFNMCANYFDINKFN